MSRQKNDDKERKERVDPVIQYLTNSELWFFYPRLSSSLLMLLMFIINSLVGSWDIKVLKAYRQQAVLNLKTRERDYLPWNSAEQFGKTVIIIFFFQIAINNNFSACYDYTLCLCHSSRVVLGVRKKHKITHESWSHAWPNVQTLCSLFVFVDDKD